MDTLEKRIESPEYANWLKAGLCLLSLKNGLVEFTEQIMDKFYKDCTNKCGSCQNHSICLLFDRQKRLLEKTHCMNCNQMTGVIETEHTIPNKRKINWINADPSGWREHSWQIAKVFMNVGQNPKTESAKETDISGLLNLIIHCKQFDSYTQKSQAFERGHRNNIMHSSTLMVDAANLQDVLKLSTEALETITAVLKPEAADSISKSIAESLEEIDKLKKADVSLTNQQEMNALSDHVQNLNQRVDSFDQQTTELKEEWEKSSTNLQERLNTIENRLDKVEKRLVTMAIEPDQEEASLAGAVSDMEEARSEADLSSSSSSTSSTSTSTSSSSKEQSLSQNLDATERKYEEITKVIRRIQIEGNETTKDCETLLQNIEGHTSALKEVKERFEMAQNEREKLTHASKDVQKITTETNKLKDSVEKMESGKQQVENILKTISDTNEGNLRKESEALLTKIKIQTAKIQETKKETQALETKVTKQEGADSKEVSEGLENIKQQQQTVIKKLEGLKQKDPKLKDECESLEAKLKDQSNALSRVVEKVENLEQDIKKVRVSQKGPVDLKNELVEVYQKLFSQDQTTIGKHKLDLRKVAVPLVKSDSAYTSKDLFPGRVEDHSMEEDENSKYCSSYRDVFYTGIKKENLICIEGDVGTGKSTWCRQLVEKWLNTGNETEEENTDVLKQFTFLFFLPLCFCQQTKPVIDLIKETLLHRDEYLSSALTYVIENDPDKCLIVLDGIDQWADRAGDVHLPRFGELDKCVKIFTSQTYAPVKVPQSIKRLQIGKLDSTRYESLVEFVLKQLGNFGEDDLNACTEAVRTAMTGVPKTTVNVAYFTIQWVEQKTTLISSPLTNNCAYILNAILEDINLPDDQADDGDVPLPGILASMTTYQRFSRMIEVLGKLAYDQKGQPFLHFPSKLVTKSFSTIGDRYLQGCLKIGLLTEVAWTGKKNEQDQLYAFPSRLIQDFLAATWMALNKQPTRTLVYNREPMTEFGKQSNMFLFACGLCPEMAEKVIEDCREAIVMPLTRNSEGFITDKTLKEFSRFCMRCVDEVEDITGNLPKVTLYSLCLSACDINSGHLKRILKDNRNVLRFLQVSGITNEILSLNKMSVLDELLLHSSSTGQNGEVKLAVGSLSHLHVSGLTVQITQGEFKKKLRRVKLSHVTTEQDGLQNLSECLKESKELETVEIQTIKCANIKAKHQLSFELDFSENPKLHDIRLDSDSLLLDFQSLPETLKVLHMNKVKMSHSDIILFTANLKLRLTKLETLSIEELVCADCSKGKCSEANSFNFSAGLPGIRELHVYSMELSCGELPRTLRTLKIKYVKMQHKAVEEFSESLSKASRVEILELHKLLCNDCNDGDRHCNQPFMLSGIGDAKILDLNGIFIQAQTLSSSLTVIKIHFVRLRHAESEAFSNSLAKTVHLKQLEVNNPRCADCNKSCDAPLTLKLENLKKLETIELQFVGLSSIKMSPGLVHIVLFNVDVKHAALKQLLQGLQMARNLISREVERISCLDCKVDCMVRQRLEKMLKN